MKLFTTILSAALIAGASTAALAQGAGSDVNPGRLGRGADTNPSGVNANPMAGNMGNTVQAGQRQSGPTTGMTSSNVSGTWSDPSWNQNRSMSGSMR